MRINFLQRSNRPAGSAQAENAPANQADISLEARNPPARFPGLKSAKSGGGKTVSGLLSHLPRAVAKQLSRRKASVGRDSIPAAAQPTPMPAGANVGRPRQMLISLARADSVVARLGTGGGAPHPSAMETQWNSVFDLLGEHIDAPPQPQPQAPLAPTQGAGVGSMLSNVGDQGEDSAESSAAALERFASGRA